MRLFAGQSRSRRPVRSRRLTTSRSATMRCRAPIAPDDPTCATRAPNRRTELPRGTRRSVASPSPAATSPARRAGGVRGCRTVGQRRSECRDGRIASPGLARAAAMIITIPSRKRSRTRRPDRPGRRLRSDDARPLPRRRVDAGAWYSHAQRFRAGTASKFPQVLRDVDVVLTPVTPYPAFPIGQRFIELGGTEFARRRTSRGLYAATISCPGLPVVAAPVANVGGLPLGVQIVAAPWREDLALRIAAAAEALGAVATDSTQTAGCP